MVTVPEKLNGISASLKRLFVVRLMSDCGETKLLTGIENSDCGFRRIEFSVHDAIAKVSLLLIMKQPICFTLHPIKFGL